MGHGGGGSERWLVSYADFITVLMVLFIVLYSMSQIDSQKYKQLAESLRAAFIGGPVRVVDPSINQSGSGGGDSAPSPITIADIPQRQPDSLDVISRMTSLLNAYNLASDVSVQNNVEGLLISVSEKLLFKPGEAELIEGAYPVLDSVAEMVIPLTNEIRVIGHTDTTPPKDSRFQSNWELSVARAITIVNYLVEVGVPPERLMAAGRSEYHPITSDDSPQVVRFNSRADIIIIYPIEEQIFDLGFNSPQISNDTLIPGGEGETP
jgi:chemotaxis protein MotB